MKGPYPRGPFACGPLGQKQTFECASVTSAPKSGREAGSAEVVAIACRKRGASDQALRLAARRARTSQCLVRIAL